MPKINSYRLPDGTRRYWFRVDTGRGPDGKRIQERQTFERKSDATAELARIVSERRQGTYVRPSNETVAELIEDYLRSATFEKEAATVRSYTDALRCARDRLGHRKLQEVTRRDVEDLRDFMLREGRKIGGKAGTGLGPRSVILALGRLQAAFTMAVADGRLVRNPVEHVKRPQLAASERQTWTRDEVHAFLAEAARDRLHAAWRLSLYGLRRGEVTGLRWDGYDRKARTITVTRNRVLVAGEIIEKTPKSRNSVRVLPLDDAVVTALDELRKAQMAEGAAAAPAYEASGYVVTDELGRPVHPEWYSDEFHRLAKRAGVRRIRLHESRHTTLSLMEKAGVPVSIIAAWAGHYSGAFTMGQYVHANPDDLAAGRDALAAIYETGRPS
jgi:integrase